MHTSDGDLIGVKSPEFVWLHPLRKSMVVAIGLGDGGADRHISFGRISQVTVGPYVATPRADDF